MKTAFAVCTTQKTVFQISSDASLTASFADLLDTLPTEKNASIAALTKFKEELIPKRYNASYKKIILRIIDQLLASVAKYGIGIEVQTFVNVKLTTNTMLTVNELYQGYLDGTNDGTGIDEIMLSILDKIKSSSMV